MTVGTSIMTWFRGALVGTDQLGNRYYRNKSHAKLERGGGRFSRERRWVIYKGVADGSCVPAEWHAWLHHTIDDVPVNAGQPKYAWQKPHLPNLTGTRDAYRPPGSLFRGGHRQAAAGDYEPWKPE